MTNDGTQRQDDGDTEHPDKDELKVKIVIITMDLYFIESITIMIREIKHINRLKWKF